MVFSQSRGVARTTVSVTKGTGIHDDGGVECDCCNGDIRDEKARAPVKFGAEDAIGLAALRSINAMMCESDAVVPVGALSKLRGTRQAANNSASLPLGTLVTTRLHEIPPRYEEVVQNLIYFPLMPGRSAQPLPKCSIHHRAPRAPRRAYSAKTLPSDALGPLEQDEHNRQSFRVLKDGKKLPLSPLLDPVVRSKRSQWQHPKERPDVANFTPFQKKLWENPFGTLTLPFAYELLMQYSYKRFPTLAQVLIHAQRIPSPPPSANAV
jgi:hypothetical protein